VKFSVIDANDSDMHKHTDQCGFDRNGSHNAGRYVCACGFDSETEIRLDSKGVLDEFIVHNPTNIHLERMDTNKWWIGITTEDGRNHAIRFTSKKIPLVSTDD
jgi:hypothetical protein